MIDGFDSYRKQSVERIKECIQCDRFNKVTRQCSVCRCFMPAKVLIPNAKCPKDKW